MVGAKPNLATVGTYLSSIIFRRPIEVSILLTKDGIGDVTTHTTKIYIRCPTRQEDEDEHMTFYCTWRSNLYPAISIIIMKTRGHVYIYIQELWPRN
jgi:hypothetical protein